MNARIWGKGVFGFIPVPSDTVNGLGRFVFTWGFSVSHILKR